MEGTGQHSMGNIKHNTFATRGGGGYFFHVTRAACCYVIFVLPRDNTLHDSVGGIIPYRTAFSGHSAIIERCHDSLTYVFSCRPKV